MDTCKLTELCRIQYGYAFDSASFTEDASFPPLVRIRDVKRGFSETYYSGNYSQEYIVRRGDILIGMDGEFNIARWQSEPALLNQRVCKIIPNQQVDGSYLLFALTKILKKIEDKTAFVTVKHLSAKELNKIELRIPNYEQQMQISSTLEKALSIISRRQYQLAKLDELVKCRFVEMFGDIELNYKLEDLCSLITDGTHQPPQFTDSGIPFLLVSNIKENYINYETYKFIDEQTYRHLIKRTPVETGDLLLSTVGSYGHPAIVQGTQRFCFQRHIAFLKPIRERVNSVYLHQAILSDNVQEQIEKSVLGVAQKTLNLSSIRRLVIPYPPIEKQNSFAAFVHRIDKLRVSIQASLDKTQQLFDSLMQEYFD